MINNLVNFFGKTPAKQKTVLESPKESALEKAASFLTDKDWISLDELVSHGKDRTLYTRVRGESMNDVGISNGDLLVLDCDRTPRPSEIVVIRIGEIFSLEEYSDVLKFNQPLRLAARHGEQLSQEAGFERFDILGVVTHVLKTLEISK